MTEVTYGRLDQMLHLLGFAVRLDKGDALQGDARVYRHGQTGALIILPVFPDEEKALPHHLAAVRATLDNFGIPHPLDLTAEPQRAS
jgi:hypothetical protein